jgi:hypothetical protein
MKYAIPNFGIISFATNPVCRKKNENTINATHGQTKA